MQLSALLSRVETVLAQYSDMLANAETTNYWTDGELTAYLNMAYREFCSRSRITHKHTALSVTDEGNSYVIPDDLLEVLAVRYEGKPLDQKTIKFLEEAYSGTAHFEALKGEGRRFNGKDWRSIIGYPRHWYLSDGYMHCFPRPEGAGQYSGFANLMEDYRKVYVAEIQQNLSSIKFPELFPTHAKNLVDVYVNGVYANPSTWYLTKAYIGSRFVTEINFNEQLDFDGIVTAVVWNTPVLTQRLYDTLTAGATSKTFGGVIASNLSIRVSVNGNVWTKDADYTYTFSAGGTLVITFVSYVASEGDTIDVMAYDIQPSMNPSTPVIVDGKIDIDYIYVPADMVNDTDSPVISPVFHDAIWEYAVFLALSREGQATQDFQKAAVYRQMFEEHVARAIKFIQPPIDVDFPVNQPFFI